MNSIHIAPAVIRSACRKIAGIAMLPTEEKPVRNLAASSQLFIQQTKQIRVQRKVGTRRTSKSIKTLHNCNITNTTIISNIQTHSYQRIIVPSEVTMRYLLAPIRRKNPRIAASKKQARHRQHYVH